jgi:hypothetical protein
VNSQRDQPPRARKRQREVAAVMRDLAAVLDATILAVIAQDESGAFVIPHPLHPAEILNWLQSEDWKGAIQSARARQL